MRKSLFNYFSINILKLENFRVLQPTISAAVCLALAFLSVIFVLDSALFLGLF
jgi:hypothetical protein